MIAPRLLLATVLLLASGTSFAHGGEHKNLKVLASADDKTFDRGMKSFAKGLGVKCSACHVKGKFASDDVAAKLDARKFLDAVVGEVDEKKKKAALQALLAAMKLESPKDEAKIWQAVSLWKRRPARE